MASDQEIPGRKPPLTLTSQYLPSTPTLPQALRSEGRHVSQESGIGEGSTTPRDAARLGPTTKGKKRAAHRGTSDKFKQLMQKAWNYEFAQVSENLGKFKQKTQEEKELKKDPAAYMERLRSRSPNKSNKPRQKMV